jgi:hypothetical protein
MPATSDELILWALKHARAIGESAWRATVSLISTTTQCGGYRSQGVDWLGSLGQVVEA